MYWLVIIIILCIFIILSTTYTLALKTYTPALEYKQKKVIHIWQGDRGDNAIPFMYKPVALSCIKFLEQSDYIIDYKPDYYNFDEIQPNEILLWVGMEKLPDFEPLMRRGVYCIYFNTEPYVEYHNTHEIWTYSKHMYDQYTKSDNHPSQIIKFVPVICEENVPVVPYTKLTEQIKLVFMGYLVFRQDKADIILQSPFMQNNLEDTTGLWTDDAYNSFITNRPNIYLNLTKSGTDILPSVRINKLLSHKCIVISDHTNPTDEAFYKDIVYFCNVEEIEGVYRMLSEKTGSELQTIADEIYERFYNRFHWKSAMELIDQK